MSATDRQICIGAVAGAHGLHGAVRIKTFTAEIEAVGAYGPVTDESGTRRFEVTVTGVQNGMALARLSGVDDREQAAALKGLRLYVARDLLPPAEAEEFYHADLIGLTATLADGTPLGEIVAVWDFGAGDSLEIKPATGGSVMVPFTRVAVPVVDVPARRVIVDPPVGLFEKVETPSPNPPPQVGEGFCSLSRETGEGWGGGPSASPTSP